MSRIWKVLGSLAIPAIGWVAAPVIKAKLEGTPLNGLNGMIDFWKGVAVKPMPVWFAISLAAVLAGAAAVVVLKWKGRQSGQTDLRTAVLPTPAIQNDLKSNVEFYLNRESKQERFSTLMKNATSVWVATHQATTLRAHRVWWDKIDRLILLEQGGFATDLLSRVTEETNIDTINNDIASAMRDAGRRPEIKSLDAFFNSMIIGSPNSGDSWVSIEIYIPWCPSRYRSSIVITETEHSAAVKNITTWFDAMWKQQPKPNERALRNEKELRLLRIHLEEARTEVAKLKLEKMTKSLMEERKGAQLSVLVRFIDWEKSHPVADEIERVFQTKGLDWHVTKRQADGSTLRNQFHSRVVLESNVINLASAVAQLFNEGNLITQSAVANEGEPLSDNLDGVDLMITVFPPVK